MLASMTTGMGVGVDSQEDILAAWDISMEQLGQIATYVNTNSYNTNNHETAPEILKLREEAERRSERRVTWGISFSNDWLFDEALVKESVGFTEKYAEIKSRLLDKDFVDAANAYLTPEQNQKILETQLANMMHMPVFSPRAFEALNLTDAQRKQMAQIKKELEPEFEETLENRVKEYRTLRQMKRESPEYQKISEKIQAQSRAFATKFKIAMFDVLTDEQWGRLQNLIDNPPEHALIFRKALKELSGESEENKESEESDVWVPGPNSWRPGDAIPMQYRLERNTRGRFPRGEE